MSEAFQPKSIIRTDMTEDIDADTKDAFDILEDLTMDTIQASAVEKDLDLTDLDALLTTHEEEEIIEKPDELTTGGEIIELPDDDEAFLAAEIAKQEVYESAEADESGNIATLEPASPAPAEPNASKALRAPRSSKVGGTRVRNLDDVAPEHFVLTTDFADDLDANKKLVISTRPSQIKVADKFDNVFLALANKSLPSAFVTIQFKFLAEHETATTKELVALLQANGYKEGTARAQVGQITTLFPILGIASRTGGTLHLKENSQIAETLADLIAGAEKVAA